MAKVQEVIVGSWLGESLCGGEISVVLRSLCSIHDGLLRNVQCVRIQTLLFRGHSCQCLSLGIQGALLAVEDGVIEQLWETYPFILVGLQHFL